jgi:hypothetical protein
LCICLLLIRVLCQHALPFLVQAFKQRTRFELAQPSSSIRSRFLHACSSVRWLERVQRFTCNSRRCTTLHTRIQNKSRKLILLVPYLSLNHIRQRGC